VFTGSEGKSSKALDIPCEGDVVGVFRLRHNYLRTHPVDLLVLGNLNRESHDAWMKLIPGQQSSPTPELILEFWDPWHITRNVDGPMSKLMISRWDTLGYESSCTSANSTQVGGVVDRKWLICSRSLRKSKAGPGWPTLPPEVIRPMANCLRYVGVPGSAYRLMPDESRRPIPDSGTDCMPGQPGSYIQTKQGTRRLLHDELCNGLGVPKSWVCDYPDGRLVQRTVALHLLEYLTPKLVFRPEPAPIPVPKMSSTKSKAVQMCTKVDDLVVFAWKPPDLSPGSSWTRETIQELRFACDEYADSDAMFQDGLARLARHPGNYDADGPNPTQLQLLWWEFPRERWDELRNGCSMNFLKEPLHIIQPNSSMTDEQLRIAEEFITELVDLGVLLEVDLDYVKTNAPTFCLPKSGQPGQWRVLADMRKGRQNEAIGPDPTIFPKTLHILDQMYTGGYSCVIADASKYFYNFPTVPEERCYLGVISTRTGKAYVYAGLAMGAGNSPSIAGRMGAAFLRKLEATSPYYQGRPFVNTWWKAFSRTQRFDPTLSHGIVKISDTDGLPAVLAFVHCDDFLVHGPTYEKTRLAAIEFLDLAVKVGLLAHPMKLTPPCQEVKYTGFLWNTTAIPTLLIPPYKVDKSKALIEYALDHRTRVSRLCLAVVKGVLESEVDATPARSGHTHLRSLEHTIHPVGWEGLPYYSFAQLSEEDIRNLQWWRRILEANQGQTSRADNASILVPTFGDGSGTGTGGTVQYDLDEPMQMWKAVWTSEARANTSNWKEAETLRLTLERAKFEGRVEIRGCTFFLFYGQPGFVLCYLEGRFSHPFSPCNS
jgi:hypothetical protein